MKKFIFCLFFLVACTSSAPKRDFSVTIYETDAQCVEFVKDGTYYKFCEGDDEYPGNLVGIKLEDYKKERDYQDLLINRCKKWK